MTPLKAIAEMQAGRRIRIQRREFYISSGIVETLPDDWIGLVSLREFLALFEGP